MPTPLTTLAELDDADSIDRQKLLDGLETRTTCCFEVVPTDCLNAACSHGQHELTNPYTGEPYTRDDLPCNYYAPDPALSYHPHCANRRTYNDALQLARNQDTLEYLDEPWPSEPEPCATICAKRHLIIPPITWQCSDCRQLWTHPEQGLRTWSPEDQALHQELWAKALLTEDYRQGSKALRQSDPKGGPDLFCCLGVATDICPFVRWRDLSDGTYAAYVGDTEVASIDLLPTVRNWLGVNTSFAGFQDLPQHPEYLSPNTDNRTFVQLNDSAHLSFRTLAEIIRSKPPGLFT